MRNRALYNWPQRKKLSKPMKKFHSYPILLSKLITDSTEKLKLTPTQL